MKTINWSRIWPHAIVVVLFFLVTYLYFSPLLDGKRLESHDIRMYYGMAKELNDYRDKTGEEALWTNSMFGGMPSYLISTMYPSNLFLKFGEWNMMLNKPANYLILSLLGFYILLLVFGANPWLALAGALGFGFSTYFFIIEAAGHHTKALAMAYMPGIVAGVVAAYHGKRFFGAMLAAVFFALQLTANHLQITYYTGLILLLFLVFRVVKDVREKAISGFLKTTGVLAFALILGILPNITSLWLVYDYSKDSTRGKSELTSDAHNKTSGLDRDYVTDYSYEKKETFNLLIPNFLGGASATDVGLRSKSYEVLQQNGVQDAAQIVRNLPTYWGSQRSTSGPVYIGAFLIFLFVLGLFLVKGPEKWWLVAATSLAIVLAWGKNFGFLTNLFLDYFPLYNKFRTVTMILVIAEMCIPLLGFLALIRMAKGQVPKQEFFRAFKWALGIVGGICLLFALAPGLFLDFSSEMDAQLVSSGWPQWIIDALREDRASMLKADAFRSLAFIVAGAGLLLAFFFKKIPTWAFYAGLSLFILTDLWVINRRYLNESHFVDASLEKNPFTPTEADKLILADKDPNFRVINLTLSTFNDASTSYFHKSIGGYHGAKMKRYQELIEKQISNRNMDVLNMLNTKYFIVPDAQKQPMARPNPDALGNAWFVKEFRLVANADSEMAAMAAFKPKNEAIIDQRFGNQVAGFTPAFDSLGTLRLTKYEPNHLVYESQASTEQLAVFSEIYYDKGWTATIDGQPASHFRANYVLRAMRVPAGKHSIEFRFRPSAYDTGENIALASSIILLLLFAGSILLESGIRKTARPDSKKTT